MSDYPEVWMLIWIYIIGFAGTMLGLAIHMALANPTYDADAVALACVFWPITILMILYMGGMKLIAKTVDGLVYLISQVRDFWSVFMYSRRRK